MTSSRTLGLCAALALAGCSHEEEAQPAKSPQVTQGQVGAEAGSAEDWVTVKPPRPVNEPGPINDVLHGARYFECTDGTRFSVEPQEGSNAGLMVEKGGQAYWMPQVGTAQFSGSYGELTVTSPSQVSLALAGKEPLRSCVRTPMAPG